MRAIVIFTMATLAIIIIASTFTAQIQPVNASGTSPFESGYEHGCSDARISNPFDRYINQPGKGPSFHTEEFMRGYNTGFNACGGGGSGAQQPQPMTVNWMQLCRQADPIIIPSCNSLVYPNNVLTSQGERAWGCIRNGLLLSGGGVYLLSLPIEVIIPILRALSEPTGCGDIVDWNPIGSVGNLRGLIDILT